MSVLKSQGSTPNLSSLKLLASIGRLQDQAWSTNIINDLIGRLDYVPNGPQFGMSIKKLLAAGLVTVRESEPTAKRGGRRKNIYSLTPKAEDLLDKIIVDLSRR